MEFDTGKSPTKRNIALQKRMLAAMDGVHLGEFEGLDFGLILENLRYLEGHGLCESGIDPRNGEYAYHSVITAQGIDYLSDDGGLTTELSTITIRIHPETIRDAIRQQIDASNASAAEKKTLRSHLENLPDQLIGNLLSGAISTGAEQIPGLVNALRKLAGF